MESTFYDGIIMFMICSSPFIGILLISIVGSYFCHKKQMKEVRKERIGDLLGFKVYQLPSKITIDKKCCNIYNKSIEEKAIKYIDLHDSFMKDLSLIHELEFNNIKEEVKDYLNLLNINQKKKEALLINLKNEIKILAKERNLSLIKMDIAKQNNGNLDKEYFLLKSKIENEITNLKDINITEIKNKVDFIDAKVEVELM